MRLERKAPSVVTTRAGAGVENAGRGDGSNAFKTRDNKRALKRQRCEVCQWCGLLLEVLDDDLRAYLVRGSERNAA